MCSHCSTDGSEYTERDEAIENGEWPPLTEAQAAILRGRLTAEQIVERGEARRQRWLKEVAAICLMAALAVLFVLLWVG